MQRYLLCVLAAAVLATAAAIEDRAFVMVAKTVDVDAVVEGRNLTIEYKLFNVGDKDASDLSVSDEYVEALQVLDGDLTYHLDHLPAGGSASFNVTLLPGAAGDVDTSRAKVEYKYATDEGESVAKSSYSSSLGRVQVVTAREYKRLTSSFLLEWGSFLAIYGGAVALPLLGYMKRASARGAAQQR